MPTNVPTPVTPAMTRREIEERATEILVRHGLFTIPVDLVTLANREGIKIHNAKFSEDGLSGMVAKRAGATTILVDQSEPPFRKNFTIAHELGHLYLHLIGDGEFIDSTIDLFRVETPDDIASEHKRKEVQANQFAAALLMPRQLVMETYTDVKDIKELAHIFNVSETAMGIRLSQLGLA